MDARGRVTQRVWGTYQSGEFRTLGFDNASRLASYVDSSIVTVYDSTCVVTDGFLCSQWDVQPRYVHARVRGINYKYDLVGNRTNTIAGGSLDTLIDAANRFDEARGIKFETFAERRIRGAMIDALRKDAWPRGVRG